MHWQSKRRANLESVADSINRQQEDFMVGENMHWKQALAQHARKLDREIHDVKAGLGIEFQDEGDVFWVLPEEPNSTVACPDGVPPTADELIQLYEKTNQLRFKVLHVVGHHLGQEYTSVVRYKAGSWECASGGLEAHYELGPDSVLQRLRVSQVARLR